MIRRPPRSTLFPSTPLSRPPLHPRHFRGALREPRPQRLLGRQVARADPALPAARRAHVGLVAYALDHLHLVAALERADALARGIGRVVETDHQLLDDVELFRARALRRERAQQQQRRGEGCRAPPHARIPPRPSMPCCRSSAVTSGRRPRNSMNASSASRLPPRLKIASRNRSAVGRSNTPRSSKAAKASAASTSAHL